MIRPQTLIVILIVLVVIERGAVTMDPQGIVAATPTVEGTLTPPDIALATLTPDTEPPATEVSSTAIPSPTSPPEPTATTEPSPTPTATLEPSPTVDPTPTERPVPPTTDVDYSVVVQRGDSGRMEVAFTFDAGGGRGYTEEMLDLLEQYNAVATFGVTGLWAQENPDLIQRILADGHQIINHSWDHASFTGYSTDSPLLGPDERQWQIEATEQQIAAETDGYSSKPYFRFPYGDYDKEALDLLGALGYDYTVWWSCDTLAWNGDPPEQIVERCGVESKYGGPGAILLLHIAEDGDLAALEPLLQDYQSAGYRFVSVEQILQP